MRFDDNYSACDYRRIQDRDDSWRHRQDDAERERHHVAKVEATPHEVARLKLRMARRAAVAVKRAGY